MSGLHDPELEFIKKQLREYKPCDFPVKTEGIVPKEIATTVLEKVLKRGLTDGPSMKAVQCLLHSIFLAEKDVDVEGYGIYRLNSGINDWFKNIAAIGQGESGLIFKASIIRKNIDIVIKTVNSEMYDQGEVLSEYLKGLVLNNLRYQIPNFAYTLGAFSCSNSGIDSKSKTISKICTENKDFTEFILYEKIDGITLGHGIDKGKVNVIDWIPIFAMILLALEVAQREHQFSHYDLHPGNIMLVENMPDYEVVLDEVVYKIIKPKYVPVLLDFGLSTVYTGGKRVGESLEPGPNSFMVPDHDMYMFIYKSFQKFWSFLGLEDDPDDPELDPNLDILVDLLGGQQHGKHIVEKLISERKKEKLMGGFERLHIEQKLEYLLTNIPGASETPLHLFKRLFRDHSDILSGKIVPTKREKLFSLKYTSSIKSYYDILGDPNEGLKQTILNMKKCTQNSTSFILSRYQVYILENYNKILRSKILTNLVDDTKKKLSQNGIKKDLIKLNKVFTIQNPDFNWKDIVYEITRIMPFIMNKKTKQEGIEKLKPLIDYLSSVKSYFDIYYTILELDLDKEYPNQYGKWVKKFTRTENYRFYSENLDFLHEGIRWSQTLEGSMDIRARTEEFRKIIRKDEMTFFWDFLFEK